MSRVISINKQNNNNIYVIYKGSIILTNQDLLVDMSFQGEFKNKTIIL